MWWTDLSPDRPGPELGRSWKFALLADGSKRFEDWTPTPRLGEITIPFVVPVASNKVTIELETILRSAPAEGNDNLAFARIIQPEAHVVQGDFDHTIALEVNTTGDTPSVGLSWLLRNFQYSAAEGLIYGEFVVRVATEELFAGRVTVAYDK